LKGFQKVVMDLLTKLSHSYPTLFAIKGKLLALFFKSQVVMYR
jgi:hypothetical protein